MPLVRPSSGIVKEGIPSSRRYLPTSASAFGPLSLVVPILAQVAAPSTSPPDDPVRGVPPRHIQSSCITFLLIPILVASQRALAAPPSPLVRFPHMLHSWGWWPNLHAPRSDELLWGISL